MKGSGVFGIFRGAWWILYWSVGIVIVVFVIAVAMELARTPKETAAAVASIHAQRLTLADVDGKHLPPAPDPRLADVTVEGIDANDNGIRDDVELAIFKKYPNDKKIRAAELQYAKALQTEITKVFNKETLSAAVWEEDRAYFCIDDTLPKLPINSSENTYQEQDSVFNSRLGEVKDQMLDSDRRIKRRDQIFSKYMSSQASPAKDFCDIDL